MRPDRVNARKIPADLSTHAANAMPLAPAHASAIKAIAAILPFRSGMLVCMVLYIRRHRDEMKTPVCRMGLSDMLHETVQYPFLSGLVEIDGELVAVDHRYIAIAEFHVEDPVAECKIRPGL